MPGGHDDKELGTQEFLNMTVTASTVYPSSHYKAESSKLSLSCKLLGPLQAWELAEHHVLLEQVQLQGSKVFLSMTCRWAWWPPSPPRPPWSYWSPQTWRRVSSSPLSSSFIHHTSCNILISEKLSFVINLIFKYFLLPSWPMPSWACVIIHSHGNYQAVWLATGHG